MGRLQRKRRSAAELGLEVVDVPRKREPSDEDFAARVCPTCGGLFAEIRVFEEELVLGDGHSVTDVKKRRGLCQHCGWADL